MKPVDAAVIRDLRKATALFQQRTLSLLLKAEGAVSVSKPQQDSVTSKLPSPLPQQIPTQGGASL
jgi:hypothetical protein